MTETNETRNYLEGIFNGTIPVKRRNTQTGLEEDVYYIYDSQTDELREDEGRQSSSIKSFSEPMAFAQQSPINTELQSQQWRNMSQQDYNNDGQHFENIFQNTLRNEGGYENRPEMIDQPTNMGIKQSTLSSFRERHPDVRSSYPEDVRYLTTEQARNVYSKDYYLPYRINNIANERVARAVYDMHVMSGPRTVAETIQQGLIDSGYPVVKDGVMGSETIGALNDASLNGNMDTLMDNIKNGRKNYLRTRSDQEQYPGRITRTDTY